MCLLITQTPETNLPDELLAGVYRKNEDGIGIMWADGGKLHYVKALFTNAADMIAYYRKHAQGKKCAVHWRMRTHGDIDLENCHPYPVFGFDDSACERPMLLMHNGVLSTGNAKDTSKSDTWHYVRDYLRPVLEAKPELMFTPAFTELIESHIGSGNRFVIMDHEGNMATLNKRTGVEYGGAWFSNTYAWDSSKYLPRPAYYYPKHAGTSVKRAPTNTTTFPKTTKHGGKASDSDQNVLPFQFPSTRFKATRKDVMRFLETIEQSGSKAYVGTTYLNAERFIEIVGNVLATEFAKMLCDGSIDYKTFLTGLNNPPEALNIIDEVDMQRLNTLWGCGV